NREEQEEKEANYYRRELRYGSFSRSISLPAAVNADKAEAVFENGVLTLTLPKAEEAKPKQIKVKSSKLIEGEKK
ncbi:MAG: Hsp20/alpha crystallin family protein, partial [Dehalococcoidales bacterium]|nr:Hsp20/alpha crystallin family protein [Dehalococcoidales bacterium]